MITGGCSHSETLAAVEPRRMETKRDGPAFTASGSIASGASSATAKRSPRSFRPRNRPEAGPRINAGRTGSRNAPGALGRRLLWPDPGFRRGYRDGEGGGGEGPMRIIRPAP